MKRVVIADDHAMMRNGIEAILASERDYEVIGVAADGRRAVRLASELKPDIMLIDLAMPLLSGLEAITQIRRRNSDIGLIALTFHTEEQYIRAALEAGVNGYVVKDDSRTELLSALATVSAGRSYLSPTLSGNVIAGLLAQRRNGRRSASDLSQLTQREQQVLKLVAEGKRTRDIAEQLDLSPKTIEKHRSKIMKKLDLHSVAAVTVFAVRNGLIADQSEAPT